MIIQINHGCRNVFTQNTLVFVMFYWHVQILNSKDAQDVKSKEKTTKTEDAKICKVSRTKTPDDVLQRIEAQVVKLSNDLKIGRTDDVLQRIETQVVEISKTLKAKKTDDVLGTISRLENEIATTR